MKKVRLGIIGCGVIGQHHIMHAAKCEHIELAAVADLDEAKRQSTAEKYHVPRAYHEATELIDDPDVQAVVLAAPTCVRTPWALRAFGLGKHVLLEKPAAMKASEVQAMLAAQGACVGACCSSRFGFLPHVQAARDLVASGVLGALRVVRCRAIVPAGLPPTRPPVPWRLSRKANGGGILVNWGSYDLDYLMSITGWSLSPRQVLARTWTVPARYQSHVAAGSDAETHVAAMIQCDGGTVIQYERGEFVPAQGAGEWEITGEDGSLHLRMTPGKDKQVLHHEAATETGVVPRVIWSGDEDGNVVHAGPVCDFAAAIVQGRAPMTDLRQSLLMQRLTDAIYESSSTGTCVTIPR